MAERRFVRLVGETQRAYAKRLIDQAEAGDIVQIAKPTRTLDQNALLWVLLGEIADAKPDGRDMKTDQWKAVFMDAAGFRPTFVPNLDSDGFLCLGYKSSRLTKAEFSDLVECIYEFGARKGISFSERREAA